MQLLQQVSTAGNGKAKGQHEQRSGNVAYFKGLGRLLGHIANGLIEEHLARLLIQVLVNILQKQIIKHWHWERLS